MALLNRTPRWESAAAGLLRFYWFRLADFAIPATTALALGELTGKWLVQPDNPAKRVYALVFSLVFALAAVALVCEKQLNPRPAADRHSLPTYQDDAIRTQETFQNWKKACQWIDAKHAIGRGLYYALPTADVQVVCGADRSRELERHSAGCR